MVASGITCLQYILSNFSYIVAHEVLNLGSLVQLVKFTSANPLYLLTV